MTVNELNGIIGSNLLTGEEGAQREVTCGYCCDLLSWVMAHGQAGMAWVTVQAHMNVVAVAALADMSCVIAAEGVHFPPDVVDKAREEGLALLEAPISAYEIVSKMAKAGIN